ncbi:DUF1761 domain-containing protein [Cellulomonas sp. Leaf334]|uniref:DUF1761 domain-containing protein n=1 Tax=Cellulomonas sp. Leaf334 TaxID=1736339 RepID=UPI0006FD01F9|nr:DUF1761 domain-containing protein [Cellulomonas sp. Leaf334]KQR11889.1 hypothetical protein ASF78_11845 [Cellulomonas sp. Leaf334]
MTTTLADLSWLAIGIATLVYYLLGALWFTPLFGTAWDTAIGRTRGDRFSASYYVVPLVSSLLVTVAMSLLVGATRTDNLADALVLGLVVGIGVALAVSVNNALTPHTPHPFRLGFITGGYHVVGIVAVTLIVAR